MWTRFLVRRIEPGEKARWWEGRAFYIFVTNQVIVMPIPLNWLAAWSRFVWLEFLLGFNGQALIDAAYQHGRRAAERELGAREVRARVDCYQHGYREGRATLQRELGALLEQMEARDRG